MSDLNVSLEEMLPVMQEVFSSGGSVRFRPNGTSMLPMLRPGVDSVTLSPLSGRPLRKYDLALYRRDNGQFVLHRIVRVGETYTCIGDNQYVVERGLRPEQMLARVSAFSRDDHDISVENLWYVLYCRLWYWSCPVRRVIHGVYRRVRRIYER